MEDGLRPSDELRKLEVTVNEVFGLYVLQYYGKAALSSVYFWDLEGAEGFASCWLVKNSEPPPLPASRAMGRRGRDHVVLSIAARTSP